MLLVAIGVTLGVCGALFGLVSLLRLAGQADAEPRRYVVRPGDPLPPDNH